MLFQVILLFTSVTALLFSGKQIKSCVRLLLDCSLTKQTRFILCYMHNLSTFVDFKCKKGNMNNKCTRPGKNEATPWFILISYRVDVAKVCVSVLLLLSTHQHHVVCVPVQSIDVACQRQLINLYSHFSSKHGHSCQKKGLNW